MLAPLGARLGAAVSGWAAQKAQARGCTLTRLTRTQPALPPPSPSPPPTTSRTRPQHVATAAAAPPAAAPRQMRPQRR